MIQVKVGNLPGNYRNLRIFNKTPIKQNESFYNFECTETAVEISWAISWVPDKEHTFITPDIFSKIVLTL